MELLGEAMDVLGPVAAVEPDDLPEVILFHRPPGLPGLEIMAVANSRRLCRWFHERYAVCSLFELEDCGPQWRYRGRTHGTGQGSLMLMEPGETHVTTRAGVARRYAVAMLSPELVSDLAADIGVAGTLHLGPAWSADGTLFYAFDGLHRAVSSAAPALAQQSLLARSTWRLIERCAERRTGLPGCGQEPGAVGRARELIHTRFREDVTLDELAAEARISRYHLCRSFRLATGFPPHAYLVRLRVAEARRLLRRGLPVVDVAAEAGFFDQSHLTRVFRRDLGVTPKVYAGRPEAAGGVQAGIESRA